MFRIATILVTALVCGLGRAEVAPEVTVVEEGYNIIAKLPCLGCPFLYQDIKTGVNSLWGKRKDQNALLLNISLPYDSAYLSINHAPLYSGRRNLPRIHANQVVQDLSMDDLSRAISSGQLEASHETGLGGGIFGLSYRQSLRSVKTKEAIRAMVFQFDVIELYSDITASPTKHKLNDPDQQMLEVRLVQKPLMSALEPAPLYEIVSVTLIPRTPDTPTTRSTTYTTMHFLEWDDYGRKGTTAHFLSHGAIAFVDYIASGFWGLFVFILGIIALFVLVCLMCLFGWGFWKDDYEKAQVGKRRSSGKRGDLEIGRAKARFKSPEELGLVGRSRVVGMGKGD